MSKLPTNNELIISSTYTQWTCQGLRSITDYKSYPVRTKNISTALHTVLTHLERLNTHIRIPFTDYISAFNTIIPSKLISNLNGQGSSSTLCYWTLYLLSDHPQTVRLGTRLSFIFTLRPGTPHVSGWAPSPTPSSCMIVHLCTWPAP